MADAYLGPKVEPGPALFKLVCGPLRWHRYGGRSDNCAFPRQDTAASVRSIEFQLRIKHHQVVHDH
jgi:hypothetical protein